MICTRMSGVTMMRMERPKRLRGSARLTKLRWSLPGSPAPRDAAVSRPLPASSSSIRLEDITGASDRLEIARELDVLLDLAAQPRHLHVDGADIAAELRLLGKRLARDGGAGALDENAEQRRLGGGEMHQLGAAGELAAVEIEAEGAEADVAHDLACRRRHALQDVADAQHQLARLERLGEIVVGAALEAG